MGVVRVEEARAGLVSAAEVRDRTGRLLLTAGQQITDRALRVLRMWGVEEIDVEGAVDPPGPPVGHLTSAVFESDRKRLEAQFHLSEKMEAIGRLAGGIAHDFNNLLMVVRGYVDLVASRLETGVPLNGEIDQIRRATDSALSLTCQLLTFARRPVLQPRVLDLNGLVADLGPMLRRLIGEDIDLATALRARPGHVKADPAQIEQVVTNLAASARDAMPRGGRLRIETANVARGPGGEPHVLLVVSDSGPGMDTATQSRLFEPVFTAKETGKGTGLRLATVYGIVRQHQGTIDVDSEPGRGTTFRIGLPAANGASASVTGVE